MKQALIYSLKVWLTTIAIAGVLGIVTSLIQEFYSHHYSGIKHPFVYFAGFLVFYVSSFLISAPAFILGYVITTLVYRWVGHPILQKSIVNLIGISLVFETFHLWVTFLHEYDGPNYVYFAISYSFVLTTCIWIYKLKPADTSPLIQSHS